MRERLVAFCASVLTVLLAIAMSLLVAQPASAEEAPAVEATETVQVVEAVPVEASPAKVEPPVTPLVEAPVAAPAPPLTEAPVAPPAPPAEEEVVVNKTTTTPPVETPPAPPIQTTTTPPTPEQPTLPTCIDQVNWSYTYDTATGSGTITAASDQKAQSTALCDPLATRSAAWSYDLPASGNPSYPQTLRGFKDVTVDTLGTFNFAPPQLASCRQYDTYAEWQSNGGPGGLPLPGKLYGTGNEEPPFLSDKLGGKGNGPTYHSTTSDGCNQPEPPAVPNPKVDKSEWKDGKFVCGDLTVTQTREVTTTPYKVTLKDGKWIVVEDTENIKTVTETQTRALTTEEIESCKPAVPEPKVVTSEWVSGEWVCGDTTVEQTRTVSTTTSTPVFVSGSTWTVSTETVVKTETQEVALSESQLETCEAVVVPPTTPPTKPVAHKPSAPTGDNLAYTGTESTPAVFLGGSLLLLGAMLAAINLRRRKATNE